MNAIKNEGLKAILSVKKPHYVMTDAVTVDRSFKWIITDSRELYKQRSKQQPWSASAFYGMGFNSLSEAVSFFEETKRYINSWTF